MKWKILVLEDDPDLRTMLAEVLSDEGHSVVVASSGEQAVTLVAQQDFDMLVTDVRMPGVDGLEALRQARGLQPELESLVVSGYTTEAETLRALQLNVGGYLKKPFSLHDLLQRVRQILQDRDREQARQRHFRGLVHSMRWLAQETARNFSWPCLEAGQIAFYLSRRLAFPLVRCRQLELAATLAWAEIPEALARQDEVGLGPVTQLKPLEQQILAVARWMAQLEGELVAYPEPLEAELGKVLQEDNWDLRQSSKVLAAQTLDLEHKAPPTHLLALAQTLEHQSLWQEAIDAYRRLREESEEASLLRQRALVGLARSLWSSGQETWYDFLKEAEQQSHKLSRSASLEARWTIAKLLRQTRHPSALQYLKQLELDALENKNQILWARARLAGSPGPQSTRAATLLLDPSHRDWLDQESDWAIEALWRISPQSGSSNLWCHLAGEYPQQTGESLQQSSQQAALEVLLKSWEAAPHLVSQPLLESLGEKASRCQVLVTAKSSKTYLRFQCFGGFEIFVNGSRLDDRRFKTQKARYVLAYLVVHPGPVSEDALIEEFWPEARDAGKSSIYAATTGIRRALRQGSAKEQEILVREGNMLRLDPELDCACDVVTLEEGLTRFGTDPEVDQRLLQLYRGPFLQGCYLDWAVRLRNTWEERVLLCLQSLAVRQLEMDPRLALETAGQGLDLDPLRQELHALKMKAYLAMGQPESGLRQFQVCEKLLRKELGLEPLTSMIELYHRCRLAQP